MHCSCGAKKYSLGSTILGHILLFGGAKNSNIAILHHQCGCSKKHTMTFVNRTISSTSRYCKLNNATNYTTFTTIYHMAVFSGGGVQPHEPSTFSPPLRTYHMASYNKSCVIGCHPSLFFIIINL